MPRITSKLPNSRVIVSREIIDGKVLWAVKFKRLLGKDEKTFQASKIRGRVQTVGFTLSQEAMNELVVNACELQEHADREAKMTAREAGEEGGDGV